MLKFIFSISRLFWLNLFQAMVLLGTVLTMFPSQALAGTASGHITNVMNSGGSNYAFRVTLDTGFGSCTDGFAYVNTSDDNYQARVATLLTLYSLNRPVQIGFTSVAGGFCVMNDISSQ